MPTQNRVLQVAYRFSQREKGFGLIEIVIALFLVVSIVAILLTSGGSLFTTRSSKLQTTAGRVASKEIEALRSADFSSMVVGGSQPLSNPGDSDLATLPNGTASKNVLNFSMPPDPKIKHVTLTINWVDNQVTKTYTTDTLIYEKGL